MALDILLSPPDVTDLEQEFVLAAMRSGWIAPAGPDLTEFEREMAARVGREHAVALSSGTAALHLALVSWEVGPGDVVPMSTLTFAATANAVRYTGATPFFVDSEPTSGNIDLDLLDEALTDLARAGSHVPCIIPVDLLGKCVDHDRVTTIARRHGVRVLWDAAESVGSTYDGAPAGSAGDAAALSFNGNKIMTTSGGGMLVTDDAVLAHHVRKLSTQAREPVVHYEHVETGYNYRLSNLLAALGRAQLTRLDEMIARRRAVRDRYREIVADAEGIGLLGSEDEGDNCWLTAVRVDADRAGTSADAVRDQMGRAGIETRPIWKPMHLQPAYAGSPTQLNGTSEELFGRVLTLPSGSAMSAADLERVCRVLASTTRNDE